MSRSRCIWRHTSTFWKWVSSSMPGASTICARAPICRRTISAWDKGVREGGLMSHHLTRRDVLKLGAGAALTAPFARASAAEGDITLCGIFSQSGAYAVFGRDTDRGIKLALSEVGGKVLGREIHYIVRDDQTNPGVGVQQVSDAIDHENAKYFVGVASSSVGLAIEQVCGTKHAMFLTSVG